MHKNIYIPVSDHTLKAISLSQQGLNFPSDFSPSEAIGLIALQGLPLDQPDPASLIETAIKQLFDIWNEHVLDGTTDMLTEQMLAMIDKGKLKERIPQMDEWGIRTVDPDTIRLRQFLTVKGEWDSSFKDTYSKNLYPISLIPGLEHIDGDVTPEQFWAVGRIANNQDDSLNIHGYAGTGKTFAVRLRLELLASQKVRPENILILSKTMDQLRGLLTHIPKEYHQQGTSFGYLAGRILPREYRKYTGQDAATPPSFSYDTLGACYGIQPLANRGSREIINDCMLTVRNFCGSPDLTITSDHLPSFLKKRTYGGWQENQALRNLVLKTAQDIWKKAFDLPSNTFFIPIRQYHLIKLASLIGATISTKHTHVIVDESHDMTAPMRQIIDNSRHCACITLGDGFQNLQGSYLAPSNATKTMDLGPSFRSGKNLETLVNPLTSNHVFQAPEKYHGNADILTSVTYYRQLILPEKPSAFIVSDHWALWEWIHRLARASAKFKLVSTSYDINHFVKDVFNLKNNGIKPTHWVLAKHYSWGDLVEDLLPQNISFKNIFKLIDRGYTLQKFMESMRFYTSAHNVGDHTSSHVLVLASNARNHEFDSVFLTPDMITFATLGEKGAITQSINQSALYVAATRAKYELFAPAELREWVEEATARNARIEKAILDQQTKATPIRKG